MIDRSLLAATESRAPGICIYGGPGLKKTLGTSTLPPPILLYEWEGGSASISPWIRRRRNSNESTWTEYSQEQREYFASLLADHIRWVDPDKKTISALSPKPGPYIDLIHYDNTRQEAWDEFSTDLGNFDGERYNSLALDSLQEFSGGSQRSTKPAGLKGDSLLMNQVPFSWSHAQERAQMRLRKIRNYRNAGCFIYMTGSEDIAKDYVRNPFQKLEPGQEPPEAYSIRGTVNLPGKLAEALAHIPDVLGRARLINGNIRWVTQPESLPGGDAHWDGKDRFGRLPKYNEPNVYLMCKRLYGEDVAAKIYRAAAAKGANT